MKYRRRDVPDAHSLLDISRRNAVSKTHNKLGNLLHVDNVLGVLRARIDNLCTTGDLRGVLSTAASEECTKQTSSKTTEMTNSLIR